MGIENSDNEEDKLAYNVKWEDGKETDKYEVYEMKQKFDSKERVMYI